MCPSGRPNRRPLAQDVDAIWVDGHMYLVTDFGQQASANLELKLIASGHGQFDAHVITVESSRDDLAQQRAFCGQT